ncbi:hypothetical protein MKX01_020941 [Papaver californicum]|nr:hypothetical protein MKX01_020941 [Papaver californicum]
MFSFLLLLFIFFCLLSIFAPSPSQNHEYIVVASSDGSVAPYAISPCISDHHLWFNKSRNQKNVCGASSVAKPICLLQGHNGSAYAVKFFGDGDDSLLLSCGDDGCIQGWRWSTILNSGSPVHSQETDLKHVLNLVNPQHEGPWGSLFPIPENNSLAIDYQGGSFFSAAGDSCAYCWDVDETGKIKMVFRGHKDYLHCIVARNSSNQIITGSEDGSMQIWDCRNGKCINVIDPEKQMKSKEAFPWVSCVGVSVWPLPCLIGFKSDKRDVSGLNLSIVTHTSGLSCMFILIDMFLVWICTSCMF